MIDVSRRGFPLRGRFWPLLLAEPSARVGLMLVGLLLVIALGADLLAPADPTALGPAEAVLRPPSPAHPLGTDLHGRDLLGRLVHGGRVTLLVGWVGVVVTLLCGTAVGLAAGLGPTVLDRSLMGLTDVMLAFPRVFLALLLVSLAEPSLLLVIGVLGLTGWMGVARLVRAEALALRDRDFLTAARGLGLGPLAIAWRHVLPNVLPTICVAGALRLGQLVLLESFLSFLGLGVREPAISWGALLYQGRGHLHDGWWLTAFPGLAITLVVIGHNLLGDGLREALDPRGFAKGWERERTRAADR